MTLPTAGIAYTVYAETYDDDSGHTLKTAKYITLNADAAQRACDMLTESWQKRIEALKRIEAALQLWAQENPLAGETEQLEKIPKWAAGLAEKDITPEMRAERDAIIKRNEEKSDRRRALLQAYEARKNAYAETLAKAEGIEYNPYQYSWCLENMRRVYTVGELPILGDSPE